MTRIETDGSYWWLDEARRTYVRTPKIEGPREPWPGIEQDRLRDLIPHPYVDYEIGPWFLLILCATGRPPKWVMAPMAFSDSDVFETANVFEAASVNCTLVDDLNAAMHRILARNP